MIVCSRAGCLKAARWAPKLCVPLDMGDTLEAVLGVPLCGEHIEALRVADFLTDPNGARGAFVLMAGRRGPPNFARAYAERVDLASAEYRAAQRARHGL